MNYTDLMDAACLLKTVRFKVYQAEGNSPAAWLMLAHAYNHLSRQADDALRVLVGRDEVGA